MVNCTIAIVIVFQFYNNNLWVPPLLALGSLINLPSIHIACQLHDCLLLFLKPIDSGLFDLSLASTGDPTWPLSLLGSLLLFSY